VRGLLYEFILGKFKQDETEMKLLSITFSALLVTGFLATTTEKASAVVYCQYVEYPAGCIVRRGVVLRPRPVVVAPVVVAPVVVAPAVRPGCALVNGVRVCR
jgi:hypothetical protein